MKCNVCRHDIKYKDKVKSIFKNDGIILCNGCKTIYTLKKNSILIDIVITFIGLSMFDLFEGFKGFFMFIASVLILEMISIKVKKPQIQK